MFVCVCLRSIQTTHRTGDSVSESNRTTTVSVVILLTLSAAVHLLKTRSIKCVKKGRDTDEQMNGGL